MIQEVRVSQDIRNSFKAYEMSVAGMELGSYKYKSGEGWAIGDETGNDSTDTDLRYSTAFQNGKIIARGHYRELERRLEAQQIFPGFFTQISANESNACAISRDGGYVYCWGRNNDGQMGNGTTTGQENIPTLVLGGEAITRGIATDHDGMFLKNIRSVSVGLGYVCAVAQSNYLYCWGANGSYRLGDPDTPLAGVSTPVLVHAGQAQVAWGDAVNIGGTNYFQASSVALGSNHTCAVSAGTNAYCWGDNEFGQLGNNNSCWWGCPENAPVRVQAGEAVNADKVDESGTWYLSGFSNISASTKGDMPTRAFSCAVALSGNPYCWGRNASGQLGDPDTLVQATTPVRVHAGEAFDHGTGDFYNDAGIDYLTNIVGISGKGTGTTCAVSDGTGNGQRNVYCWGNNLSGEVGDPDTPLLSSVATPKQVHAGQAFDTNDSYSIGGTNYLTNVASVTNASTVSCAVSNGTGNGQRNAYCWGDGSMGQLGNNQNLQYRFPVRVWAGEATSGGDSFNDAGTNYVTNITEITNGTSHACAVSSNYKAYCWGIDSFGQIGNGTPTGTYLVPEWITGD